jgi:hypothetical protein
MAEGGKRLCDGDEGSGFRVQGRKRGFRVQGRGYGTRIDSPKAAPTFLGLPTNT